MKSFQVPRNVRTPSVTRIGRQSGRTIDRKIRSSPAPSIRAASRSSSGTEEANCRTRKIPKMLAIPGRITPGEGVDEPHRPQEEEDREHRNLPRDHHRREEPREEAPAPREAELCKRVPGRGVHDDREERRAEARIELFTKLRPRSSLTKSSRYW
jgi:hypothetical protein